MKERKKTYQIDHTVDIKKEEEQEQCSYTIRQSLHRIPFVQERVVYDDTHKTSIQIHPLTRVHHIAIPHNRHNTNIR